MSTSHSITRLLSGVKKADDEAVQDLFAMCYARVAAIGRSKLAGKPQRGFDEDDVANSAFREFLSRAAEGGFRRLENREDVWQVLTLLVGDKIGDRLRRDRAQKRGGGMPDVPIDDVMQVICNLDDPSLEAEFADAKVVFYSKLPSDEHRRVVELMEEGLTHEEIADRLNVSLRTVARRLDVIRSILQCVLGIAQPAIAARNPQKDRHEADG